MEATGRARASQGPPTLWTSTHNQAADKTGQGWGVAEELQLYPESNAL